MGFTRFYLLEYPTYSISQSLGVSFSQLKYILMNTCDLFTSFAGKTMLAVLSSVASNHFVFTIVLTFLRFSSVLIRGALQSSTNFSCRILHDL